MGKKFNPRTLTDYMNSTAIQLKNQLPIYDTEERLFLYNTSDFHQQSLYDETLLAEIENDYDNGNIKTISEFYEILTSCITGGQWVGRLPARLKPDVVTSSQICEVKFSSRNNPFKIKLSQLNRYLIQQCSDFFYLPQKEINFYLYRTNLERSESLFKEYKSPLEKIEKIIETFSNETGFLIIAPFSVMYPIFTQDSSSDPKKNYKSEYTYPLSSHRNMQLIRFKASGIKKMLFSPEEFLELYNLNPEDYLIDTKSIPSPS